MDPLVPIALSVTTGTYVLLVGSGLSRAAGVPTGYDVNLDLIRLVARMDGGDPGPDPAAWYVDRFAAQPTYGACYRRLHPAADRIALAGSPRA